MPAIKDQPNAAPTIPNLVHLLSYIDIYITVHEDKPFIIFYFLKLVVSAGRKPEMG